MLEMMLFFYCFCYQQQEINNKYNTSHNDFLLLISQVKVFSNADAKTIDDSFFHYSTSFLQIPASRYVAIADIALGRVYKSVILFYFHLNLFLLIQIYLFIISSPH